MSQAGSERFKEEYLGERCDLATRKHVVRDGRDEAIAVEIAPALVTRGFGSPKR
jgi:hypothetical protein